MGLKNSDKLITFFRIFRFRFKHSANYRPNTHKTALLLTAEACFQLI